MTVQTYKLTGRLPVVDAVDGATKWTGTVRLEAEATNIDAIVQSGGLEAEPPAVDPVAEPKGKTAPKE